MQKILLLEDDTSLGNGICLALQSPTVQLTLCRTPAQAQNALAGIRYDLLIPDVNLPDGSGLDLLRQVRQADAVPVILLTANDMELDKITPWHLLLVGIKNTHETSNISLLSRGCLFRCHFRDPALLSRACSVCTVVGMQYKKRVLL